MARSVRNFRRRFLSLIIPGLLASSLLFAREFNYSRQTRPFPVRDEHGILIDIPMTGGLNTPIQQFVDIDGDGDPDLFLQDRANQLIFYRNTGSPAEPRFEWSTDQFNDLEVGAWFKFNDLDGDGDYDLFAEKPFGVIRYYRNEGTTEIPAYRMAADTLKDRNGNPIFVEGYSIPEWADIDCDGDQDLFLGKLTGTISFYRHIGVDAHNLPVYQWMTDTFQDLLILTGGGLKHAAGHQADLVERHGANSLTFVDIDHDQDPDLFWGDFFAPSIIFVENQGTCQTPLFQQETIQEQFPINNPLSSGGFNVPRFTDIDADGDYDMFVCMQRGAISTTFDRAENFYFYQNTGTPAAGAFSLITRQFIESIDIGQNTVPALVDIDADGDLDLFLANELDLDSPDGTNSRVYFYENQGSAAAPAFRLMDRHYLNFDRRFDENYSPVFVDIDSDGAQDLFIGKWDGKMAFYHNDGTVEAPEFNLVTETYSAFLKKDSLGVVDVGNNSTPVFIDIDADDDFDLFIGEFSGNINFFRNTGTKTAPEFLLDTDYYFAIDIGGYSYPHFVDIDRDDDPDLVIGSDTAGTVLFRNIGSPQSANFILDESFRIPFHLRTTPQFADLDGDGDLDILSGVNGGGIVYYENLNIVGIDALPGERVPAPTAVTLLKNYPNPFNPQTRIRYEIHLTANQLGKTHRLIIYDVLGQNIREWEFPNNQVHISRTVVWDARNQGGFTVPSGIYFYQLNIEGRISLTRKMALIR